MPDLVRTSLTRQQVNSLHSKDEFLDIEDDTDDDIEDGTIEENDENENRDIPIPMHPSLHHIYSENAYYYELEDVLEKSPLSIDLKGDNSPIDYYLYMYILVNNRDINPYILCLLEYNEENKLYQFPQIQYTPYTIKIQNDEKEDNVHEIEINNLCFSKVTSVFNITDTDIHDDKLFEENEYLMKSILQHNSKQIIPIRTDNYVKYLTVNPNDTVITNLSQYYSSNNTTEPPRYAWCSLDEIMRKKKVYNHNIHPDVYELFLKNKMYHTIRDENMATVEIPRMMYSCFIPKKTTTHDQNEFITERNSNKLLPNMSQYDTYGDMYFFSDDLLHHEDYQSIYSIPRYIVFLGYTSIVGNNNQLITELNNNELIYSSVRFSYDINTFTGNKTTTIVGVVSPELFYSF